MFSRGHRRRNRPARSLPPSIAANDREAGGDVKPEPARAPDIKLYPSMVPRSFHVMVKAAGEVLDLTDSEITAPVYDEGVEVGALEVEKDDLLSGRVKITITQAVYDAIGRYATWRFHEGTIFDYPLIEQRWSRFERSLPYVVCCS
jgi:hypothetical protein